LESPAKINLFLHILGTREDRFHELESLMCPVNWCDRIHFESRPSGIELEVSGIHVCSGSDNLAYRAAVLVREAAGLSSGVRLHLEKSLPLGGGLGGGSSNAATVLKGCNQLWNAGLSQRQLHEMAATLGSDVNLFLERGPCLCRGRGERVEPLGWKPDFWAVLLNPGFSVPTPWAFKTFALLREEEKRGEKGRYGFRATPGRTETGEFFLRNDLEPAVFSKYVWIESAKEWLLRQSECLDALMSGSGATLFALTEDAEKANSLNRKMRGHFGETALIHTTSLRHD